MGLNFLRFSEQQVRKDMDLVLKAIEDYIFKFEKLILLGGNRIINTRTI
jgi:very-short-patch-repair endonuclease